jgi:sporulation protein YlmC with PRC-barrel domain
METYQEEDLLDGLVVDKEGYICGYVANFSVEPDNIIINLYEYDIQRVQTLNEDELVQRLLAHLPEEKPRSRFSFSSSRKSSHEALYDRIKQKLNLPRNEPLSLENLVDYATAEGIEIPYQIQELKTKTEKGSINWSYVDKIAFSDVGKCILLNDAVEAKNRNISLTDEIGFKSTEDLAGRIVLDSEGKIVGSAVKLLVGFPPGILITLERVLRVEQSDPEALKRTLVPNTYIDIQKLFDQVKNDMGLKSPTDDDLLTWARRRKIDVPNKVIERRELVMELTLSWDQIAKIGDVVILKKDIESLIEESTRSNVPDPNRRPSNPRKR